MTMHEQELEGPDVPSARLRNVIATINQELLRLPRRTTSVEASDGLFDAWSELLRLLALAPTPQLRRCPMCSHVGMRAATLCGYCWSTLPPLPELEPETQGALPLDEPVPPTGIVVDRA